MHGAMRLLVPGFVALLLADVITGEDPPLRPLPDVEEARGRARLLHEAMHPTLQFVHHEYYREDEGLTIPAATLRKVFKEMQARQQVELRWLAVNAQPMNADHVAKSEFEKLAVAALAEGKEEFEGQSGDTYRRAATITLSSECLKCHAPNRTTTEDRMAALVVTQKVRGSGE